jgi:hypothetical protein
MVKFLRINLSGWLNQCRKENTSVTDTKWLPCRIGIEYAQWITPLVLSVIQQYPELLSAGCHEDLEKLLFSNDLAF